MLALVPSTRRWADVSQAEAIFGGPSLLLLVTPDTTKVCEDTHFFQADSALIGPVMRAEIPPALVSLASFCSNESDHIDLSHFSEQWWLLPQSPVSQQIN